MMPRTGGLAAVAFAAVIGVGCGSGPPAGSAGSSAQAGVVRGTVRTSSGKPLPDVRVTLDGAAGAGGYASHYETRTDSSGRYLIKPTKNETFHPVIADLFNVNFEGHNYQFHLDAVKPKCSDFDSTNGLVQDFVWNISGPKACSTYAPSDPNGYEGGAMNFYGASGALSKMNRGQPLTVTLVPTGPLIDGSTGKTLIKQSPKGDHIDDIPVGKYRVTVNMAGAAVPIGWCYPPCSNPKTANFIVGFEVYFPAAGSSTGNGGFGLERANVYG